MDDRRVRVLVIDDEASVRESLADFLSDFDFAVSTADSAEEAMEILAHQSQDLAVVDIRLPGMSGDALILMAYARCPGLQFLIHTGSTDYSIPPSIAALGIDKSHVFHKPLADLTVLVSAIAALLGRENSTHG